VGVSRELGSTLNTGKMGAKQRPCFEQSMSLNLKVEAVQELFDPVSKLSAIEKYHIPQDLDPQVRSVLNGGYNFIENLLCVA
jgi:hypothetical protein